MTTEFPLSDYTSSVSSSVNSSTTSSSYIFNSYQTLKSLNKINSGIDLQLAKELTYMKHNDNYKVAMGDDDATWKSFVAQPELQPLKISKAYRLVRVYETYIEKLGLKEEDIIGIDSNSLMRLSTVVNANNVADWLAKAQSLSRSDLYRELNFGEINELECEHDWRVKTVRTCKKCGAKENVK